MFASHLHTRRRAGWLCAAAAVIFVACASEARADPIVFSNFNTGAEGWNVVSYAVNSTSSITLTSGVTWQAADGNPGGHLSRTDPQAGSTFYFNAPAQFLGDVSAAFGGSLTYDLRRTAGTLYNAADVILVGGASPLTLVFDGGAPATTWTSFNVPFSAGQWRVGTLSGAFATPEQILDVLSSLTALRIRGEFVDGTSETGRLDNVALHEPVPEPATLALMGTGLAGVAFVVRRQYRARRRARTHRPSRHAYTEPHWVSL